MQTLILGGWLLRDAGTVSRVRLAWRTSIFAGLMGAAASAGWFTATAIEPAAHVRTLGLIELLFSYAVSRKLFRERLERREMVLASPCWCSVWSSSCFGSKAKIVFTAKAQRTQRKAKR